MSHNQFITDILNIKEDLIKEIFTIKQPSGDLIIKIKLVLTPSICPCCGNQANIHGYIKRKLVHSILVDKPCCIIYQQRRFKCKRCSFTFSEKNPFASPHGNMSHATKINILRALKSYHTTYTDAAERFNVSKQSVLRLFDKHVNIPRKQLPAVLSIDEHYFPNSDRDALYCCVLMDFLTGEILDLLPDRRKKYLGNYFSEIKAQSFNYKTLTSELSIVQYISIDLYDNYRDVAKMYFPKAVICADSFHVIKNLMDYFSKVRLRCRTGTEDPYLKYLLTHFKYIFRHEQFLDNEPRYNKYFRRYMNLRDFRDYLFQLFPDLEIAYNLKEFYIMFNENCIEEKARTSFEEVVNKFANSGIEEYDPFYRLLLNWQEEIINSFKIVNSRRINNSFIESKNRLIGKLIENANGFTNFKRTRNRILYCLNPNDTYTF